MSPTHRVECSHSISRRTRYPCAWYCHKYAGLTDCDNVGIVAVCTAFRLRCHLTRFSPAVSLDALQPGYVCDLVDRLQFQQLKITI